MDVDDNFKNDYYPIYPRTGITPVKQTVTPEKEIAEPPQNKIGFFTKYKKVIIILVIIVIIIIIIFVYYTYYYGEKKQDNLKTKEKEKEAVTKNKAQNIDLMELNNIRNMRKNVKLQQEQEKIDTPTILIVETSIKPKSQLIPKNSGKIEEINDDEDEEKDIVEEIVIDKKNIKNEEDIDEKEDNIENLLDKAVGMSN
jgi:cell division protein FtsL